MDPILDIMRAGPVIPVLRIADVRDAVPIARALVAGGVTVLEVTLRTPAALDAIRAMQDVPGAIVGAGTVLDVRQFELAREAGAHFVVSPGATRELAQVAASTALPWLPGAVTPSEVMAARDAGLRSLKFFPAVASGGTATLTAYAAVFPDVTFCPTGGVTVATAPDWLRLPNVACVGGTWLVSDPVDPVAITAAARAATALRQVEQTTDVPL